MVEKLKLILRQIHWSLAVKALISALAWYFLPFGLFLLVAFYFYFRPFYQPMKFIVPFTAFLVLTSHLFFERSLGMAILAGIFFFIILGVKDLIFVGRRHGFEVAVLFVSFLLFLVFFSRFDDWGASMVLWSLLVFLVFFLLLKNLTDYNDSLGSEQISRGPYGLIYLFLSVFILWQLSWVLFMLPLSLVYKTALLFITSFVFSELNLAYLSQRLSRRRILGNFSLLFVAFVLALASNSWTL